MSEVPPHLTSVTNRGDQITINWTDASTGVTINYYVVLIYQVSGGAQTPWGNYKTQGPVTTLTFRPQASYRFNPALNYVAQVYAYSSQYPNGLAGDNQLPVANAILASTITGVGVDDGNNVTVQWTDPTPYPGPNYYTILFAWSGGARNVVTSNELDAFRWTFKAAPPLGDTGAYTVTLFGYYSAGTGPGPASNALNVLYQQILASQVSYDGATTVSVAWPSPAESGATAVSAFLTDQGATLASSANVSGTSTTLTPASALSPAQEYKVALQVTGPATVGPMGPTIEVIVGSPTVQTAAYSGGVLALGWSPVLQKTVLGFQVTLTTAQSATTILYTRDATLTLPVEPAAIGGNTMSVAAVGYNTSGPAVTAALVSATTEISGVSYAPSTGIVTASWSVSSPPAGAAYELAIFDGGGFVTSATSGNTASMGTVTVALTSGRSYTARARATLTANGLTSVGPWSGDVAVLVGAPAITATAWDGETLSLTWTGVTEPGVIGYRVVVSNGTSNVVNATVVGTELSVPIQLSSGLTYTATVTTSGAASAGPASAAATLVPVVPELTQTSYSPGSVTVQWTVPSTPATFVLALFDGGGLVATTSGNSSTGGTLSAVLVAGRDYTVRARGTAITNGAVNLGPWSGAAPVLVGVPAITSANWEGELVTLAWSAVNEPGVLGYQVTIASGGVDLVSAVVSGTSLAAPLLPAPASTYVTTVTTVGAVALGPAPAPATTLLPMAPALTAISYSGGVLAVTWSVPATPPTGTSYVLELLDGGSLIQSATAVWATAGSIPVALAAGHAYSVRVRVCTSDVIVLGPWSGTAPVLIGQPTLAILTYDGLELGLGWNAVAEPGVRAYVVMLASGATTIASTAITGTSTVFPIALAAGSYTVGLSTTSGALGGSLADDTAFVVPAAPVIATVAYQGGAVGVTWAAVPPATGYLVELLVDYAPTARLAVTSGSSTSATLTAALDPDAIVHVRLTALAGYVAGAASAPVRVIAAAPMFTNVYYDGANLAAAWTAVAPVDAGAISYTLAVVQGQTLVGSTTSASTDATLAVALSGTDYTAQVRAVAGTSTGPWSAGDDPQRGDTELFFSPTATATPYLYRSSLRPPLPASLTSAPVTLYFPDLFNGAAPTDPPSGNSFSLAQVSGGGVIRYSISVAAAAIWQFSSASIRTALRSDYLAFLEWMEPSLRPGAAPFVQRALALGLPLSFAETLLYRYGFSPQQGYVDLAPGMRLRLDAESYQLIPGASPADLNGFVGASSAEYELMAAPVTANVVNVAFDSFLSLLGSTSIDAESGGMGGVIDLYGTGGAKPYYRLFYPAHFPASNSQGYSDPSRNVALVGASSISALETATTRYLSQGNFNGIPSSSVSVFYFRGRLVALPRIVVFVDGEPAEVSIGTSLRQLIGPTCSLPFQEALPVTSIAVERAIGGVVDTEAQLASRLDVASSNAINFNDQTLVTYLGTTDWFDLPLLGGDRVLVGGGA